MNALSIIAVVLAVPSTGAALGMLAATLVRKRATPDSDRPQWRRGGSLADPSVLKGRYRDLYP